MSVFDKKRISFNFKKLFKEIHDSENFTLIALDYPILPKMITLKDITELHDKIIVSTAKYLNLPIITKDENPSKSPQYKNLLVTSWESQAGL